MPESGNERFDTRRVSRAIVECDLDAVKVFVTEGLNLRQVISEGEQWNALHLALGGYERQVDPDFVRYLIDQGADVAAQDLYGMTPLHYAARSHRAEIVRVLAEAGAPANVQAFDRNETPLALAIVRTSPSPETMDALLAAGEAQHDAVHRNWLRSTVHTIPGHEFMKDLVAKYLDPELEPED